jgi:hypothetical protein
MKNQEDGTVIQRFCIAILQKMSVKEDTVPIYMKYNMIEWIVKLLQRSRINDVHIFCLDFASALLANILHSNYTIEFLENNISVCKNVSLNKNTKWFNSTIAHVYFLSQRFSLLRPS